MPDPLRVLFVEDLPTDQELAEWQLRAEGIDLTSLRAETRETFLHALEHFQPDLIISDYSMPEFDGMQALLLTQELQPNTPFIVLTGSRNEDTAVECIKAGASDYVIKEHMHRLPFAVREALKQQQVRKEKALVEEQLRTSEVRYRGMFENSPISLSEEDFSAVKRYLDDLRASGIKDFDAYFNQHPEEVSVCSGLVKVMDVNQATLGLFGAASKADMRGNLTAILCEDNTGHFQKELVLIAGGETQFNLDAVNRTLDGRTIRLNLNWAAVPGHADDLSKVIVSNVDVTARRQAEEALRASEVRYRGLFEDSPISLWEEDFSAVKRYLDELRAGGVKDFDAYFIEHPEEVAVCAGLVKVVDVNKVTLEIFGVASKAEMVANLVELIPSEHVENLRSEMVLIAAGKTQFNTEAINHTLDGRIINLNLNWAAVPGYTHDLSKVIVSMVDVTARKQAEATLLQKVDELQRFQRLTVGRELKMIELKQEINAMLVQMGQPAKYRIAE